MRIVQISDFHFTRLTWNPFRLLSKRIFGVLNWLLNRRHSSSEAPLYSLPDLFRSLKVDLILLGGDFSTTALREEFEAAAQFINKFSQPWIAIPGNHDFYTGSSFRRKDFYRYFTTPRLKEITHPVEFFTLKSHAIEAHPIASGWWVVALDTCPATRPGSSHGLFSEKLESYLKEVLQLIPQQDSILLFNHYPLFQTDEPHRSLKRAEALQRQIEEDHRIRLYLHGHTHRQIIADLQPNGLPIVLDSGSCVLGKESTWNLIDLTPDACIVHAYAWKHHAWIEHRTERFSWKR